ncbi:zinc finger protein 624-like [Condylostylus longicornis]|uniref:zinc finger protein 624-like n=1 Tax=Condylostylus longicornis TaxID=2530218 RepID=UPI00244DE516|nr:zinc finger protein 624-like [Condylostylus longicornis]
MKSYNDESKRNNLEIENNFSDGTTDCKPSEYKRRKSFSSLINPLGISTTTYPLLKILNFSPQVRNVPSSLTTQLNQQQLQHHNQHHQAQNVKLPLTAQNLNLELNNQTTTNLEQLSPSLPFQNLSPRSQRSIYTDISSPFTSILSPHSTRFTPNPHYMSPDSQYLSSNSILSPFSQHLSPHPNNFTIQTTSTNPLHIYAESPRSTTSTSTNLIGNNNNQYQLSRNEDILNNLKNNNKSSEQPAPLPNILATLDDLTSRQQNQKNFINKNDDIIGLIDRIDNYVVESNPNNGAVEINNSKVEVISQQYIPPSPITPISNDQHINQENEINILKSSVTTAIDQQLYDKNLSDIPTSNSLNSLVVKVSTLPNIYSGNQLEQRQLQVATPDITTSQNLTNLSNPIEVSEPRNNNGHNSNRNKNISKLPFQHSGPDNNRKYLNLPIPSPTPSLPEFDFIRRQNNNQNNNDNNNLSTEACFKEPGSVASYYSAPANLGSERILDDFAFPNFFRDNELNTPNVDDFYTQQLHNFFEGQVISFQNPVAEPNAQNCNNIEPTRNLDSHLQTLNNVTHLDNNYSSDFTNNNNSMHLTNSTIKDKSMIENSNTNICNSNTINNNNNIINDINNENPKLISSSSQATSANSQPTKSNNFNGKSHFKPQSLSESNKMLLSQHYINKIILFECKLCGKYYKNERSYSKHQKTHAQDSPKCDTCGKTFQSTKRFLNHDQNLCKIRQEKRIKSQTSDTTTSTEIKNTSSSEITSTNYNSNSDFNLNTSDNVKSINNSNFNDSNIQMNDKCVSGNQNIEQICNENNQQQQEPQEKQLLQIGEHNQQNIRKDLNKVILPKKCRLCPRTFIREAHLRKHEKNHDIVYKCEHCPRSFRFKNACQAHMRVHTGEKPFKCNTCPAAFATNSNLKAHQLIHTEEKPFECSFGCGKAFSMKRLRKWHERIHTGEKPFQCDTCGKNFAMQSRLNLHYRQRHMDKNLRPHECLICSKRFLHPTGLKDHMNMHNGDRPYQCPFDNCDKRFPNQNRLWEHKKLHSSYKRYTCQICNKSFIQYTTFLTHKKYCNSFMQSSSSSSL